MILTATMPTPRETILTALHAALITFPATTLRGDALPERVPTAGLLILRDSEPGEPEVTLSPLRYHYEHRAETEAVVQGANRETAFDTHCASVGAVIAADRTLGGLPNDKPHKEKSLKPAGKRYRIGAASGADQRIFFDTRLSGSASTPAEKAPPAPFNMLP